MKDIVLHGNMYICELKIPYYKTGTPKIHLFKYISVNLQKCEFITFFTFDQADTKFHYFFLTNKDRVLRFVAF